MKKHEYAQMMGLTEEAVDWVDGEEMPEYNCDWCSTHVPDGHGQYVGDDRICEDCWEKRQA